MCRIFFWMADWYCLDRIHSYLFFYNRFPPKAIPVTKFLKRKLCILYSDQNSFLQLTVYVHIYKTVLGLHMFPYFCSHYVIVHYDNTCSIETVHLLCKPLAGNIFIDIYYYYSYTLSHSEKCFDIFLILVFINNSW